MGIRLSRRQALALAAGRAGPARYRFRYVISTCLYGHGRIEEILPEVRRAGAEFIDVWPEKYGSQREQIEAMGRGKFLALLARRRVRVGVLSRYDLGPFRVEEEFAAARELGCRTIVCGAGGPGGLSGDELKRALRDFAEKMKPRLARAAELGITLAIENHGGSITASPDALRWLIEMAPAPLAVALAPYHLEQEPVAIARLIGDLAGRIGFLYAWQRGKGLSRDLTPEQVLEQLPGRGPLDFRPICRVLAETGYAGWVSVFMHTVPGGVPIRETTRALTAEIIRAQRYLNGCLPG